MIILALNYKALVSLNGARQTISYSYKDMSGAYELMTSERGGHDYFIALYADGRVIGKYIAVELEEASGILVGVAFRAGVVQFERCNFTFLTKASKQVFELVHSANTVILLNSHIYIDGETSTNLKGSAIEMMNSTIEASEMSHGSSRFTETGGFMTQGPICQKCRTGSLDSNCVVCPIDEEFEEDECRCKYPDTTMEDYECVSEIIAGQFIEEGAYAWLMECQNNKMITLGVTTSVEAEFISTFKDDSCGLTNLIIKGYLTHNVYIDTEMGGIVFRINKNISYVTSYLNMTKYGWPTFRAGNVGMAIENAGFYDISNVFIENSMLDEVRNAEQSYEGSFGGLVAFVGKHYTLDIVLNVHNIISSGQTIRMTGVENVGLLFGLVLCQKLTFSNILITSKTAAFYLNDFDLSDIDLSQIEFPCKDKTDEHLMPSLQLSHIAKQYYSTSGKAEITGELSNAGGLIGHYCGDRSTSGVHISRTIAIADVMSSYNRDLEKWQNAVLIGTVNETTNFTIASAFVRGTSRCHCRSGAIAFIEFSNANIKLACDLEVGAEYSSGPIGCAAEESIVNLQTAAKVWGQYEAFECAGIIGTVETNTDIIANGCFGQVAFEYNYNAVNRANSVGLTRSGSKVNGMTYPENEAVQELPGNWMNEC